jgi:hypothetical protein
MFEPLTSTNGFLNSLQKTRENRDARSVAASSKAPHAGVLKRKALLMKQGIMEELLTNVKPVKAYYRVMLGAKSIHAAECFAVRGLAILQ